MTTLKELRKKLSQPRAEPVEFLDLRRRSKPRSPVRFSENGTGAGDLESEDFFYISLHSSEPGDGLENEVRFPGYIRQGVKLKKADALAATMSAEARFPIHESEDGIIMHYALSDKFGDLIFSGRSEKKMAPTMGRFPQSVISVELEDRCLL